MTTYAKSLHLIAKTTGHGICHSCAKSLHLIAKTSRSGIIHVTPIFANSNMSSNLENMYGTPHSSHTCAEFRVTHFWHSCARSLHLIAKTTGREIIHMMSIFSYGSVVSISRKFGYHTQIFTRLCLIWSVIVSDSLLALLWRVSRAKCPNAKKYFAQHLIR